MNETAKGNEEERNEAISKESREKKLRKREQKKKRAKEEGNGSKWRKQYLYLLRFAVSLRFVALIRMNRNKRNSTERRSSISIRAICQNLCSV